MVRIPVGGRHSSLEEKKGVHLAGQNAEAEQDNVFRTIGNAPHPLSAQLRRRERADIE